VVEIIVDEDIIITMIEIIDQIIMIITTVVDFEVEVVLIEEVTLLIYLLIGLFLLFDRSW
jgi:hypothetical protein